MKSILGNIFLEMGALDSARSDYESAIELYKSAGYTYGTIPALRMLSEVYHQLEIPELRDSTLQLAMTNADSLGDDFEAALIKEQLGKIALSEGRPQEAIISLNHARRYFRKVGVRFSSSENLLAKAYELNGDEDTAARLFESAVAENRKIRDSHQLADALFHLARIDANQGGDERARERIRESLDITEEYQIGFSSPGLRRSYNSTASERYELFIKLLMRGNAQAPRQELAKEAFQRLERFRAQSLVETLNLSEAGSIADGDAEAVGVERGVLASLNANRDRLTDLLRSDGDPAEIRDVETEISALSGKLDDIRTDLKTKNPIYSAFKYSPAFDLDQFVSDVIGKDELLFEYFLGQDESYLWLIGKDEYETFVLPPKDQIEKKIDALRELHEARKQIEGESFNDYRARVAGADARYLPLARELSNLILGPVADRLAEKRLIIVPDGKLHSFPVSALPLPKVSSDNPILLTNEVIYQPSAQTYALLKTLRSKKKVQNEKDLLVFSDPVFSSSDDRLTGMQVSANVQAGPDSYRLVESYSSLSRLPASGEEAATIFRIVGGDSDQYSGFDATRDRLLGTNLADYRVLHLATHGFVDAERPELSSIIFSRYDPAGNQINESVRMQDIYAMKLNADLVVLSACKTGAGKEVKGEGVMGMNTAFLQAGARSVVSTLWQVEDNAANVLMKEFYRRMISDGMPPSAALRAAQIKLYHDPQFRSPFFWAAFTVHGDANTSAPFERDRTNLVLGISAALLLGIVCLMLFLRRSYRTSKV